MYTATGSASGTLGDTIVPTRLAKRGVVYPTANLGPLTTSFKPADRCSTLSYAYRGHYMGDYEIVELKYGRRCDPQDVNRLDPSCFPARYAAAYDNLEQQFEESNIIYPIFSPASNCPAGYSSACGFDAATASTSSPATPVPGETGDAFAFMMSQLLESTQTAVGCCPSGYSCLTNRPYSCVSQPSLDAVITADGYPGCKGHTVYLEEFTATTSQSMYVYAPCIVLAQDVSSRTAEISTTQTKTNSASSASASNGGDNQKSGLSTGAKAAIGVCVPLFVIFAGLALFAFYRRRSRGPGRAQRWWWGCFHGAKGGNGWLEMDGSDPRQSTMMGSPSDRVVSVVSDWSGSQSQSAGANRTSELYGSMPSPRLHDNIVELPAESEYHVPRKPVPEASSGQ